LIEGILNNTDIKHADILTSDKTLGR